MSQVHTTIKHKYKDTPKISLDMNAALNNFTRVLLKYFGHETCIQKLGSYSTHRPMQAYFLSFKYYIGIILFINND